MILTLNLHSPPGEATRRLITRALNVLKEDNRYVINAMRNSGQELPWSMWDMGLVYNPPDADEANTPKQDFWGIGDLLARGEFSCGDAAACEAAIIEEIFDIPTEIITVPQGAYEYHALYLTPSGPVDPSEDWIEQARSAGITAYDGYLERGGVARWKAQNPFMPTVAVRRETAMQRREMRGWRR